MKTWMLLYAVPVLGIVAVGGGLYLLMADTESADVRRDPETILLLSGAALEPPVAGIELEHGGGIMELFLRRTGTRVEAAYDRSARLLEQARSTGEADLLLPDDASYIEQAEQNGLVDETRTIATLVPVIMVARGNPHGIEQLADLVNDELRFAMVPADSGLGRVTAEIFDNSGVSPAGAAEVVEVGTAMEAAEAVQVGRADAAIVWEPFARQFPRTEQVEIPAEHNATSSLVIAVLEGAYDRDKAIRFADFIASPVGMELFSKYHYTVDLDD